MDAPDHIQRAVDWIEENLRAEICIEDAAREAGFSVWHFSHLFVSATGLSVMQFITQRRIRHAAYEISRGRRIVEAALEYGFNSASGFTRAFRREFGCSPREYSKIAHPLPPEKVILKEMKHIMISQKLIARALAAWNITESAQSLVHSSGVRSENTYLSGDRILHVRENRAPLALSILVEEQLRQANLPSVQTFPTANGEMIYELDGLFFRLSERAPGAFLSAREMYSDFKYPQAAGKALARLHEALKPLNDLPELNRPNLMKSTLEWSLPETARAMNLSEAFMRDFTEKLNHLFPQLPRSPIHRNPTPDAFLFDDGRLTGYANFDMTEVNIRLFDICYAATAILSESLGRLSEEMIERWPEVLRAIAEGYDRVSPLTEAEWEAIPYVVCAVQMVCVAYFSSQAQFQALAEVNVKMTRRIIRWLLPDSIHS